MDTQCSIYFENKIFQKCINKCYFPKDNTKRKKENRIQDLALVSLYYLASMKENPKKSPFTEEQMTLFKKSDFWAKTTIYTIKSCYVLNTIFFVTGPFLGLIPGGGKTSSQPDVLSNSTSSSTEATFFSPLTVAYILSATTVFANALAVFATGTAPNNSSNAFNEKQDTLKDIQDTYKNLSHRLIVLYFSINRSEAETLASEIDTEHLKNKISNPINSNPNAERIVKFLRDAIHYIKENTMSDDVEFNDFIKRKKKTFEKKNTI